MRVKEANRVGIILAMTEDYGADNSVNIGLKNVMDLPASVLSF